LRLTRVYSDAAGESHFAEIDIPLQDSGAIGWLSERHPVKNIIFRENDASYDYDWHCAPQRQYIVLLDGEIEIETSDGESRRFLGGDILLVEDVCGRGHRTRTVNNQPRRSVFITLD
jgi:hypothetical protein